MRKNPNDLKTFAPLYFGAKTNRPGLGNALSKEVWVVDTDTGFPLENVHVYVNGKGKTITNQQGRATVVATAPTDQISFSHVSFKPKTFVFANMGSGINLDVMTNELDTINLTAGPKTDSKTNWIKYVGIAAAVAAIIYIIHQNQQNQPKKVKI